MIRNHQRAVRAHADVESVKTRTEQAGDDKMRVAYGAICHKLPILVHNEGLAVALHFVAARDPGKQALLGHLAGQLHEGGLIKEASAAALLNAVRKANLSQTQSLTREVQRCLDWYKRFAKTVIKADGSEDDDSIGPESEGEA
jgi:CRISPR/Cas system CMR-associated protein Cmr5 small subunit